MDLEKFDINKQNQIIDGKFIGYHHNLNELPIKKGDIVIIKKGTIYSTTRSIGYRIAGKNYKVKVDHLIHGAQYIGKNGKIVKNTEVTWAGSGGYWHRADINEVEKVNE